MRAPIPSSVTRIASQRRPVRVTVQILRARFTREAAKAVNCHKDRIPNTPDPCDCGHFPKKKLLRHEGLKQGNCHEDNVP